MSLAGVALGRLVFGTSPFGLGFALVGTLPTRYAERVEPIEPLLSATASLAYLLLVAAVVGPNADGILGRPVTVAVAVVVALALHGFGYAVGWAASPLVAEAGDRVALLFTASKKEFSIAAFVVFSSGLPPDVALPAVTYAVVQMATSPIVARRLADRAQLARPERA